MEQQHKTRFRVSLAHLLVLAAVLRFAVLLFLPDQGFPDAKAYIEMGKELIAGQLSSETNYMPLYPIWAALTGGGIGLKIADIGLSVLTVWLAYTLAIEVSGRKQVGLIAALGTAIYPHFLFYAVSGLTETAYIALMLGVFLTLYRKQYVVGSLLVVLSILIRPSLDFLAPLLLVCFVLGAHQGGLQNALKAVGVYAVLYVLILAPWWAHNYAKYGQFVRLNLGDGLVLYSGNNPANTSGGGVNHEEGDELFAGTPQDVDYSPFTGISDPVERNATMKKMAVDYILANPKRFVELAGIKFLRFWRLWPYAPEYEKPYIIAASIMSYGVVLVLAGLFLMTNLFANWRLLSPILLYSAYLTAIHMVTIASIRYRLPIEPFLIIFSAWFISDFAQGNRFVAGLLIKVGFEESQ